MTVRRLTFVLTVAGAVTACFLARTQADPSSSAPTAAANRSSAANMKDLLLARCVAQAYRSSPDALRDASATASILVNWTEYDADASADASDALISKYLARDYSHPLIEYKDRRFDLLKCFDMYHSTETAALVKRYASKRR